MEDAIKTTAGRDGIKEKKKNFYANLCKEDIILELQEREVKF